MKACPGLWTPATRWRPRVCGRLGSAFRQANDVGIATTKRFRSCILTACFLTVYASSPTSHPVRGNTRYRSARYALTGLDLHQLDSFKEFHVLIFVPLFPNFSQRDSLDFHVAKFA